MIRLLCGILWVTVLVACTALPQQSEPSPREYLPYPSQDSGDNPEKLEYAPYYGVPAPAKLSVLGKEQTAGVGTYVWRKDAGAVVHADAFAVVAPSQPLTVTVPFTATLILPVPLPPTSLESVLYPVTYSDLWGAPRDNPVLREFEHWNPPPYPAQDLPQQAQLELVFDALPESLYIYHLRAEWTGLGSVYYGFLLYVQNPTEKWDPQIPPPGYGLYPGPTPLARPTDAPGAYPTP